MERETGKAEVLDARASERDRGVDFASLHEQLAVERGRERPRILAAHIPLHGDHGRNARFGVRARDRPHALRQLAARALAGEPAGVQDDEFRRPFLEMLRDQRRRVVPGRAALGVHTKEVLGSAREHGAPGMADEVQHVRAKPAQQVAQLVDRRSPLDMPLQRRLGAPESRDDRVHLLLGLQRGSACLAADDDQHAQRIAIGPRRRLLRQVEARVVLEARPRTLRAVEQKPRRALHQLPWEPSQFGVLDMQQEPHVVGANEEVPLRCDGSAREYGSQVAADHGCRAGAPRTAENLLAQRADNVIVRTDPERRELVAVEAVRDDRLRERRLVPALAVIALGVEPDGIAIGMAPPADPDQHGPHRAELPRVVRVASSALAAGCGTLTRSSLSGGRRTRSTGSR